MFILIVLLDFLQTLFKYRTKPRVLQLPITAKCNSRCLTCNIWKDTSRVDIPADKLEDIFKERYFSKIESVGINGGEPTLHRDFDSLLLALFTLPRLKSIYLISNSINAPKLLLLLENMKCRCNERGIKLGVTISVDGIADEHDYVRGISGSFSKTLHTIETILADKNRYCDSLDLGCTISKYNVYHLAQIESFFESYPVNVTFHLAVPNKRILTFGDAPYSVLTDSRARIMAQEFFLGKYLSTRKKSLKVRYFLNYYYLRSINPDRLSICGFLRQNVTIDENLNLYLCATASDCIGNLTEQTVGKMIKSGKMKQMERKTQEHCATCIHYASIPNLKGLLVFGKNYINDVLVWYGKYRWRAKWLK